MAEHSSSRRMKALRQAFFDEGRALADAGDPEADCWLCRLPIDYDLDPGTDPHSHNLDHYYPVADYPDLELDPSNFRHAHQLCNQMRSNNGPSVGLGEQVPDWW